MPRKGITAYDLLISCPGDVSEYLDVIKDSVENFNKFFGKINNIEVVTKHWSTDSYPQSGDKPQNLLNSQLVRDCDAAIAIFWTRFGTPTDKYGSGTEEEIEEMLSVNKQVFMYFLDAPTNPSEIDMNQHQKVLDFREKYKDRGVYAVIKDKHELQREFTNHLAMHFLPLISGEKVATNNKLGPVLQIRDRYELEEKRYSLHNYNLCNSKLINDKKDYILGEIQLLRDTILPERIVDDQKDPQDVTKESPIFPKNINMQKLMGNIGMESGTLEEINIDSGWIETINNFAAKNKIKIEDAFWNVGDLKSQASHFYHPIGVSGPSLRGPEKEEKRYSLIEELYWDVKSYNEYVDYFNSIDEISVAKLVINNAGDSFDEDIDIKLIIPKGCLLKFSDLPYPGISIIEELTSMRFTDYLFSIKESEDVVKYGYYPIQPPAFKGTGMINPFNQISDLEQYKIDKEDYLNSLESIFLYKYFEKEDNDILTFQVEYLKHNTSMTFPSVLMFKEAPAHIKYEISSKHMPDVLNGKLELIHE